PVGFRPIKRPTFGTALPDAVIYQLHVRDFTIDKNSGVSEKNRGKFLGLTETGTRLPGDPKVKTGLDHLRELGVTHVQLQPIQDFDNDEDHPTYNWGYMTAFFNSPEGWFASDHRGAARIAEFKKLVQALHDAGIGVIMDVVYNHTGTQNTLEFIAPGYYLRMRDDGSFWNGSGTGNEVRSEAPMARQFIVDSLKFWAEEYGVDGFRLDLMGLIDLDTLKEAKVSLEKINPNILFYGEPWAATGPDGSGAARLTYKDVIKGTGIAAFNDHFRDAIKGSPDGKDAGYVVNGDRRDALVKGIAGSIDDWTASPVEAINYASVHDNLDLWDKLKVSAPGTSDEDRAKMVMLAGGILAVSQGAPLFHCGVDFCRDKKGNNNSYNAGDEVNQIDWSRKKTYGNVNAFFQGAIAIRRAHPVFRMKTAEDVRKRLKFVNTDLPDPKAVVFTLDAAGLDNEPWNKVAVFINPTASPLKFKLPFEGEGAIQMQNGKASTVPLGRATGTVEAGPHSMTLVAW
ncbi:MAG: type I pullulanase, partial [Candidatus Sumerlaeaceae bacterium]|nr:type I pullulanase [Candidatus Sumerlaeaceae bacterium]